MPNAGLSFVIVVLCQALTQAVAQSRPACRDLMNAPPGNAAVITAPARCKVTGTIEQTIGFEVNLPANWNNKLLVVGIGGNAGTITDTSPGWRRNCAGAAQRGAHHQHHHVRAAVSVSVEVDVLMGRGSVDI